MSAKVLFSAVYVISFLLSVGCQKKTDYLYFNNPNRAVAVIHKIKEFSGNSQLDILWVIDNSQSMEAHQADVITNASAFIDGLVQNSALQWKMGLISTTNTDSPYVGFESGDTLDYTMTNASQRFKTAVGRLGLNGDGYEKEYDPIMRALQAYPGFLRPNAYLAIIIVSDAKEQSSMSTSQFLQQLSAVKGGKLSNVLVYAFVNPEDWCTPTDDTFMWQGSKLQDLLTQVQGSAFKLCDPAFGQNIANLGSNLAQRATSPRIDLKDQPILSTLQVWHAGQLVPGGPRSAGGYWEYDVQSNAVIFSDLSFAPDDNETVRVTYEVDQN